MYRVKFYSENDWASGWEFDKIIERIKDDSISKEWLLEDLIEFFNISKYLQVERFAEYIQEKTSIVCIDYLKKINARIGKYLNMNKSSISSKYDDANYSETEDFLEIIDRYKLYEDILHDEFKRFLDMDNVPLYMVLKHKKIIDNYDDIVKDKLMSDFYNAETIISKFLYDKYLHLPLALARTAAEVVVDELIGKDVRTETYMQLSVL